MFTISGNWQVQIKGINHIIRAELTVNNTLSIYVDDGLLHESYIFWAQGEIYRFENWGHQFTLRGNGFFRPTMSLSLLIDGRELNEANIHIQKQTIDSSPFRIVREGKVTERIEVVDTEEIPLDNSAGAGTLVREYEVSRTETNELSVQTTIEGGGGVGADLFSVIKAEISAKLSKQSGQKIGQTVTVRDKLTFSVPPHSSTLYTVVWKRKLRESEFLTLTNGKEVSIHYQVTYGLMYEVKSGKLT